MSLIEDLRITLSSLEVEIRLLELKLHLRRERLFSDIRSGKYGTEIMLDYLDCLGGDSVEFVRKQQEKGKQSKPL